MLIGLQSFPDLFQIWWEKMSLIKFSYQLRVNVVASSVQTHVYKNWRNLPLPCHFGQELCWNFHEKNCPTAQVCLSCTLHPPPLLVHYFLHISYKDHVTNEEVRAKIQQAIRPHEDLLTTVKKRKLQWYGHVSCSSGLAKTILQGTVKGGRRQGRQRKRWEDNIREWTGLEFGKSQRTVENREKWRKLVAKSSVVPQRPSRLRDWRWWWWTGRWAWRQTQARFRFIKY